MVVIYQIKDAQTIFVQVEVAALEKEDWKIHDRNEGSQRTRTAVTIDAATRKLRENSVYLDDQYITPALKKILESNAQNTMQHHLF